MTADGERWEKRFELDHYRDGEPQGPWHIVRVDEAGMSMGWIARDVGEATADRIIADHAKAALLDDSTARIADRERERDELRQDWLEHTQLLRYVLAHMHDEGDEANPDKVAHVISVVLARLRPPETPQ